MVYGNRFINKDDIAINEALIILEKSDIDPKYKSKIDKCSKVIKNTKASPFSIITACLFIVGMLAAIIISLPYMAVVAIVGLIFAGISKNAKYLSEKKLEQSKKELEDKIKIIEGKAANSKNPDEYKEAIKKLKDSLVVIERELRVSRASKEKKDIYYEIKFYNEFKNIKELTRSEWEDKTYGLNYFAKWLVYNNISDKDIINMIKESGIDKITSYEDFIDYFSYDDEEESKNNYKELAGLGKEFYFIGSDKSGEIEYFISKSAIAYANIDGSYFEVDWDTFSSLRSKGKSILTDKRYIAADAELGYYKLSEKLDI